MKIRAGKVLFLLLLLLAVTGIAGCGRKGGDAAQLDEGEYYTYYVNQAGTALVSRVYEAKSEDTESLIRELVEQCQTVPNGRDGHRAIPSNVTLARDPEWDGEVVSIYFDTTYTLMDQVTELLCRAALAKTLTQLDEVSYISIYVSDQPQAVLINGSDFVDNTGDVTNQFDQAELILYYANEAGTALRQETRYVVYSSSLSLERVVLSQLIEGPSSENDKATLPATLKVQEVSVKDGVCYVDFDSAFLDEPVDVTDVVEIYSVVNSLIALSTVTSVQITINGSSSETLRNNISLSGRFEQNMEYVETETGE